MTIKEALNHLLEEYPGVKAQSVVEYKNLYVFSVAKKGRTESCVLMNPIAVIKDDGTVFTFHPLMNNPKEYFKAAKNPIKL